MPDQRGPANRRCVNSPTHCSDTLNASRRPRRDAARSRRRRRSAAGHWQGERRPAPPRSRATPRPRRAGSADRDPRDPDRPGHARRVDNPNPTRARSMRGGEGAPTRRSADDRPLRPRGRRSQRRTSLPSRFGSCAYSPHAAAKTSTAASSAVGASRRRARYRYTLALVFDIDDLEDRGLRSRPSIPPSAPRHRTPFLAVLVRSPVLPIAGTCWLPVIPIVADLWFQSRRPFCYIADKAMAPDSLWSER